MSPVCRQKEYVFRKPHEYWRLARFAPSASERVWSRVWEASRLAIDGNSTIRGGFSSSFVHSDDHQHPHPDLFRRCPRNARIPSRRPRLALHRGCGGGGAGWLIFKAGRSEMGVHPTHSVYDGKTYESPRHHLISLMCDDISNTVAELKGKGRSSAAKFRITGMDSWS